MCVRQINPNRRSGATAVEFAFVAIPLFMFFFGTAEYARFFLDRNILNNAAREGARYGVVNYYNAGTSLYTDVQTQVNGFLAGRTGDFSGGITMTITLVPAASNTAATTTTLTGSGSSTSAITNFQPGDYFEVKLSGTYVPILPMPIVKGLPSTISMQSTCIMLIEGVT